MHWVHKPALAVLLLFAADRDQESILVQENREVAAAMKRDRFKCNLSTI